MKMLKIGLLATIIMPAVVSAGTYHWTGAVDGAWTNPANWAEGSVPGRYKDSGGNIVGAKGDTVIFGDALTGNAVTAIDFTDVYSVSNLLTQGSHRYTYGTDANQFVSIEPYGAFSAAETATTPVAVQVAKLRNHVEAMCTEWNGEKTIVRNNSREEFVMGSWGNGTKSTDPGAGNCTELGVVIEGTGDIRMTQDRTLGTGLANIFFNVKLVGNLIVDTPLTLRALNVNQGVNGETSTLQVYITERGMIQPCSCYNYLSLGRPLVVSGEGPFKFGSQTRSGVGAVCQFSIGNPMTINCPVESLFVGNVPPPDGYPHALINYGGNPLTITGENSMNGIFQVASSAELVADCFGMRGTYGRFGDMDFLLSDSAKLRYTGAGETTDRLISVTNTNGKTYGAFCLHQHGAGEWNVNSAISYHSGCNNANMYLGGDSAHLATFGGTLPANMKVLKYQSNEWAFAPQNEYTGPIEISGGTLRINKSMHINSLSATANGVVKVVVDDGVELEIDTLTTTADKKIDFVLSGTTSKLKANNAMAASGMTGVTVNGHQAIFDENKNLKLNAVGENMWKFPASGEWNSASNWAGDALPDLTRNTFIDAAGGDYTVTVGDVGEVTTTNLFVNNNGAGKATLFINNVTKFNVRGHTTSDPLLTIAKGGRIEVLDSHLWLIDQGNAGGQITGKSSISLDRGELLFRGNSSFVTRGIWASEKTDPDNGNLNTMFVFGTGTITFEDNAELRNLNDGQSPSSVYYHQFIPTRAGETTKIQFKDNSRIAFPSRPWELRLGGNKGTGIMEIDTTYPDLMVGWQNNFIGVTTGIGELRIKRGRFATGDYDNLLVGTIGNDTKSGSTLFTTGRVVVAEGAYFNVRAQMPSTDRFNGAQFGHATSLTGARGTSYVYGEMLLAGTYEQKHNPFIVGTGPNGHGKVHQTGGSAVIPTNPDTAAKNNGEMAVGIFGGEGLYQLDAGTVTAKYHVYVGGATTNDLHKTHQNYDVINQYHDAKGTIKISGGSFATTKNILLGCDGTGRLELSGDGVVSADTIVVSNTVGQAASGIRFTADANRKCGKIATGTKLVFNPNAKVVVDVSAVAQLKNPRRVEVWNLDESPVGLTESQLVLEGAENLRNPNSLVLSPDGKSLAWNITNGTVLLFR